MRPLTIGIDARAAVEEPAGRGRVVRELLRGLSARADPHRYVCFARSAWDEPLGERFEWRLISGSDAIWHLRTARAANRECDAFLCSNSYVTPLFLRVPAALVVYDLVTFDPLLRPKRRAALIERATLGLALRRVKAVVAISHATAEALVDRFPEVAGRVEVAPLGALPSMDSPAHEVDRLPTPGYVLAVGTLEPRKNLPRLAAAYRALPLDLQADHPLVVVGKTGWRARETLDALRSLGDRCILLGYVSDEALAELYRRCAVFCYPSLGEGFGLPVLEAMTAGAPVLTSSVPSLAEVGGEAVEYADPNDVASIAAGLERLLRSSERRSELSEAGRARAEGFSWARTADQVLEILERIASGAGGERSAPRVVGE